MASIDYIKGAEADTVKQGVLARLQYGRWFWKPLHARMDLWANMYLMLDAIQQAKPIGVRRFISNDPRTAVDAAISILTRNEVSWNIDLLDSEDENQAELLKIGRIERTLRGINLDIDEMFSMRLQQSWWTQAAFFALVRGYIWGKLHITDEALKFRDSPIIAEIYDPRTVYPTVDSYGLSYVVIEKLTNLGDMVSAYPVEFGDRIDQDPNTPVIKIEYWSNDRPGRKGITGTMAFIGTRAQTGYELLVTPEAAGEALWIIPPFEHGYSPTSLPVFGVAVNGIPIKAKPVMLGVLEARLVERSDLLAMQANLWHGPNTWVAETGRSILSSVEELVPQYNELIATIFQHFSIGTYGTWVFTNPTGELPNWRPGIEAMIPLKPNETVDRKTVEPISVDAYRLVQILQQEREKGVLSNILQAVTPASFSSGVMLQQVMNAALNALGPFVTGLKDFGIRMGTSALAQCQAAAGDLQPFELTAPTKKNTYFRIEFDPARDLDSNRKYRPVPLFKPALPDDLTIRATAARMLLDPRRPIMSLQTVLENVMQVDDVAAEMDHIWEDIALTDPVIVLEQIAQALERHGELEMAKTIRENEFQQNYVREMQFRQATGNLPAAPGRGPADNGPPQAGMSQAATAPGNQMSSPPTPEEGAATLAGLGGLM